MLLDMPYFMENKDWFYRIKNEETGTYKYFLTVLGKSIPEVVKSYEEHQKQLNEPDMVFIYNSLKDAEESIRNDLKAKGLAENEIEKQVSEWKERISK